MGLQSQREKRKYAAPSEAKHNIPVGRRLALRSALVELRATKRHLDGFAIVFDAEAT
jgi:hypothetical protein